MQQNFYGNNIIITDPSSNLRALGTECARREMAKCYYCGDRIYIVCAASACDPKYVVWDRYGRTVQHEYGLFV